MLSVPLEILSIDALGEPAQPDRAASGECSDKAQSWSGPRPAGGIRTRVPGPESANCRFRVAYDSKFASVAGAACPMLPDA
jgi:hypothetical protein